MWISFGLCVIRGKWGKSGFGYKQMNTRQSSHILHADNAGISALQSLSQFLNHKLTKLGQCYIWNSAKISSVCLGHLNALFPEYPTKLDHTVTVR